MLDIEVLVIIIIFFTFGYLPATTPNTQHFQISFQYLIATVISYKRLSILLIIFLCIYMLDFLVCLFVLGDESSLRLFLLLSFSDLILYILKGDIIVLILLESHLDFSIITYVFDITNIY